jgi:hypothetical protein
MNLFSIVVPIIDVSFDLKELNRKCVEEVY